MADLGSRPYSSARLRREVAHAGLRELELQQKTGELLDAELLRRGLEGVIINQRTILLGLPAEIGRDIDEPEIRVRVVLVVERRVREALEILSNYDPIDALGDEDDQEDGAVERTKTLGAERKKRKSHG
jgi:hypothetical protein